MPAATRSRAAPERKLWASNWPHPSLKRDLPDAADLIGVIADWRAATRYAARYW
ncbi:MAG: hypothetical protein HY526_06480 [Betaproteobacteria bacterium]|nr:hypothetical protein [Betaproteobacteria bacterium]